MDLLVEAALAIMAMGEGGDLIHKSITENGNYDPADEDPPVDGYDYVSVSVETYEDELAQALADLAAAQAQLDEMTECCEDVAEILGAVPEEGQSCCDAVKGKAQETIDENEEYEECCAIVAILVGLDPTDPDFDPSDVPPAVEAGQGYTFPAGTTLPDVLAATGGGDYIQDTTLGIYLSYTDDITPSRLNVYIGYTTSDGVFHQKWQYTNDYASYEYVITSVDGTTGTVYYEIRFTSHGGTVFPWENSSFQDSALIGYGSSGHEYKAKNKE